jgi:hypothetical protein
VTTLDLLFSVDETDKDAVIAHLVLERNAFKQLFEHISAAKAAPERIVFEQLRQELETTQRRCALLAQDKERWRCVSLDLGTQLQHAVEERDSARDETALGKALQRQVAETERWKRLHASLRHRHCELAEHVPYTVLLPGEKLVR